MNPFSAAAIGQGISSAIGLYTQSRAYDMQVDFYKHKHQWEVEDLKKLVLILFCLPVLPLAELVSKGLYHKTILLQL